MLGFDRYITMTLHMPRPSPTPEEVESFRALYCGITGVELMPKQADKVARKLVAIYWHQLRLGLREWPGDKGVAALFSVTTFQMQSSKGHQLRTRNKQIRAKTAGARTPVFDAFQIESPKWVATHRFASYK